MGTMFALPWYLTWFGHSLNQYRDVVRLYDYFLASPPLMPLYVATALVIHRRQEVFDAGCDMASVHVVLSQIPDNLDFEEILVQASKYYKNYPPDTLEGYVKKRIHEQYVHFGIFYYLRMVFCFLRNLLTFRLCLLQLACIIFRRHKNKHL